MTGYRGQVGVTAVECRLGMEFWWQGRLHATWLLEELFLRGNERVAALLPESFRVLRVLANEELVRSWLNGSFGPRRSSPLGFPNREAADV